MALSAISKAQAYDNPWGTATVYFLAASPGSYTSKEVPLDGRIVYVGQ